MSLDVGGGSNKCAERRLDTGCIIVARAVLGHPFVAEGPMQGYDRPPRVEGLHAFHDSTIVPFAILKGKGKGKGLHSECTNYDYIIIIVVSLAPF